MSLLLRASHVAASEKDGKRISQRLPLEDSFVCCDQEVPERNSRHAVLFFFVLRPCAITSSQAARSLELAHVCCVRVA